MQEYLVATSNPHKTEAIRRLLSEYPLTISDLSEHDPLPVPEENGESFEANALIKSRYYCRLTGCNAVADDSGLEVDALNGEPGIHSSRYGGEEMSHADKMTKILAALEGVPEEKRTARFRCVAAVTYPDGREYYAEGKMEGRIALAPKGDGGFGYDPIFLIPELGQTVAELSPEQKDSFSHRGHAFRNLMEKLQVEHGD